MARCRRPLIVLIGVVVSAVIPSAAAAAVPDPRATFLYHDHETRGNGWHIELTVSRDSAWLSQLVLHSERCDATILTARVKVRRGGRIASAKPFTTGDGREGMWSVDAVFVDRAHFRGTLHVTTADCDGGVRRFNAHAQGHDGGHGHRHGGGGHRGHRHEHVSGTREGRYPNLGRASATRRAQVRRLWRRSLRAAATRFPTARDARVLGYRSPPIERRPPLLFHLRHRYYKSDGRFFDARRVESLVYWRPRRGRAVLLAFMYRLPMGMRPRVGGPLLGWHRHGTERGMGTTKMTHVWLTRDLRSAVANCLPVVALERAQPGFRFDRDHAPRTPESAPCPSD
jgi:hypothetical protein